MAQSYEDKIKQQARSHLNADEQVLAAFITQPRGSVMAMAGGVVGGEIGARNARRQTQAAAGAGLELANPMALALSNERLIVFSVSRPLAFGKGGDIKGLVSAVPVSAVTSIKIKRLLVGTVIELCVDGQKLKLEAGAGANVRGLSDALSHLNPTVSTHR